MIKKWYESKTVQGILIACAGVIASIWLGETEITQTIITVGLGLAGYGLRDALDMKGGKENGQ